MLKSSYFGLNLFGYYVKAQRKVTIGSSVTGQKSKSCTNINMTSILSTYITIMTEM